MNNKGFTLIEVLCALVLISLMAVVIFRQINTTLSVSGNEAYKLMKNSIVSASETYIRESEADIIKSNFSFDNNNSFKASILKEYGYFTDLKSPIDGKYVGDCLVISATKKNANIIIDIEDNCY